MATYAIGDIHGCYDPLCRLLDKINFDQAADRLWFTGDLVNRGPQSLEALRLVKSFGDASITVLGNHDIHLLAIYYGVRKLKEKDNTLFQVLDAEESDELITWLKTLPVAHIENDHVLVHAGVHPQWSIETLITIKSELETAMSAITRKGDLADLYGDTEGTWNDSASSIHRLRYAINCLTRMRYCNADTSLDLRCSDSPGKQPDHLVPWYKLLNKEMTDKTIIFGHWASLGYHQHKNVYALDSGCVWGNTLTALRLEDKRVYSVNSKP